MLDVLFGTLVYRPGDQPARLGVAHPERYPRAEQFWQNMLIPLPALLKWPHDRMAE